MKRLLGSLERLSYLAAWALVLFAGGLFFLEESGTLERGIEARLAAALEGSGASIQIDSMELRWFEPGVELYGVRLVAEEEVLALERVSAHLRPALDPRRLLRRLEVRGGRVFVSTALQEVYYALAGGPEPSPIPAPDAPPERTAAHLPELLISDLEVALETPDTQALPLGWVDLALEHHASVPTLSGRLRPTLAGPEAEGVHLRGHEIEPGLFSLHAAARELGLDDALAPTGSAYRSLPVRGARGTLSLDATLRLALDGRVPPEAHAHLRVEEAAFDLADGLAGPRAVELELDFAYEARMGRALWSPSAWTSTARLEGEWLGTPLEAWVHWGRNAGPGQALSAWATAPAMPVDRASIDTLGLGSILGDTWDALGLDGRARTTLGMQLAWSAGRFGDLSLLVHGDSLGAAEVTYHGWVSRRTGVRYGIPIPVVVEEGGMVFATGLRAVPEKGLVLVDPLLALIGLEGRSEEGLVRAEGLLSDGPEKNDLLLDLLIDVPTMEVGRGLEEGLMGMPVTQNIWTDYAPQTGQLSSTWHLYQDEETNGLTAFGRVDIQEGELAWKGLPVPVRGVSGTLEFLWAEHAADIEDPEPQGFQRHRPFGLQVKAEGDLSTRGRAKLHLALRDEPLSVRTVAREAIPKRPLRYFDVELDEVLLRGSDWDVLTTAIPELGASTGPLGVKGMARARYRGSRPRAEEPYRFAVHATPVNVLLQPESLEIPVREVRGGVSVLGEELAAEETPGRATGPGAEAVAEPKTRIRTRMAVRGALSQGTLLSVSGTHDGADGRFELLAAGLDPGNAAVRGTLRSGSLMADDSGSPMDLSGIAMEGELDASLQFDLSEGAPPAVSGVRLHLRDNDLSAGNFRFDELRGVLRLEDKIWRAERPIQALLAQTPVTLDRAFLLDSQHLERLAPGEQAMLRGALRAGEAGFLLHAELAAEDLPLDPEHLSLLLDEELLEALVEGAQLRGNVDVERAHLTLFETSEGRSRLSLRGPLLPNNVALRVGLPVRVSSGRMVIEDLILEDGRLRGWGRIEDLYGSIAERELSRAGLLLSYVEGHLAVQDFHAELEGGRLFGLGGEVAGGTALAIDFREPHRFDLAMRMEDVDAKELLAGLFESSIDDTGSVRGALRLSGRPDRLLEVQGSGWVKLEGARLWSIPVIRALFSSLGLDRQVTFDEMRARFRVRDGKIHMNDMEVHSPFLRLHGKGTLDLDGSLHHDLEVRYSLIDQFGPLTRALYVVQNSLLRIAIRGDMARPEVILRNSIIELLTGLDEPERKLPLPALSALPERF